MSVETEIIGENPAGITYKANVVKRNGDNGLVVFTDDLKKQSNLFQPAVNPLLGNEMAINASFGGTPDGIHNGLDNVWWTASAISGTWDFASATNPFAGVGCIEQVSNSGSDEALITRSSALDSESYVGISGKVRLEQWGGGEKHIELRFRLAGVDIGVSVNIDDFIDTSVLSEYQTFNINFTDFGVGGDIDELVVTKNKISGSTPKFRLDNIQVEETGGASVFVVEAPFGRKFLIQSLYISYVDALDISLVNATAPAFSYDKLMNEAALDNGIVYQIIEDGEIVSSLSTSTLGDNLKGGASITSLVCDGTNTCLTLEVRFGGPLVLDSRYEDSLSIIIGDDLSGLISFTALASGVLEHVAVRRPEVREG
jgi:hypothetical protein